MSCSRCGSTVSCGCSSTPFYSTTDVCSEDHSQKFYQAQYSFSVCPQNSWNVPGCGLSAILEVPGVIGATVGAYLWHPSYGYYQITSVDSCTGHIGVVNSCLTGNAAPGTQVAQCTCFIVTDPPSIVPDNSNLFPFVALDFTAPAIGDCIDITVTTSSGLQVGDIISIGTGLYTLDSFVSSTVIRICNTGEGIAAGTAVIAQDAFGNYQYPIATVSNCCATIDATIATAITDLDATFFAWVQKVTSATTTVAAPASSATTAPVTITLTNPSATRIMRVHLTYVFTFYLVLTDTSGLGVLYTGVDIDLQNSLNGAAYASVLPFSPNFVSHPGGSFYTSQTYVFNDTLNVPVSTAYTVGLQGIVTAVNVNTEIDVGSTLNTTITAIQVSL